MSGKDFARTGPGLVLQADELQARSRTAASVLLLIAVLQTISIAFFARSARGGAIAFTLAQPDDLLALIIPAALAGFWWCLYLWAKRAPLPAAVVGLTVYVSLWLVDFVLWYGLLIGDRGTRGATGVFCVIIVVSTIIHVAFISAFARAIRGGVSYRQLARRLERGATAPRADGPGA